MNQTRSKKSLLVLLSIQAFFLLLCLVIQPVLTSKIEQQAKAGETSSTSEGQTASDISLRSHLIAGGFAFVWMAGIQTVVFWLFWSRLTRIDQSEIGQQYERNLSQQRELVQTRDAIIFGLAQLAESRDNDTGKHLERIATYSTRLASATRNHPIYKKQVSPIFVRTIGISSVLHDIGKVGISDSVLLKPGRLSEAERKDMQEHALVGAECIAKIEARLGENNFLQMAKEIALYHHERWDGTGYPFQKQGEEIPIAARIVSIADVYDALRSRRPYKREFTHREAVETIVEQRGTQFDPLLVDIFLEIQEQMETISETFQNSSPSDESLELAC